MQTYKDYRNARQKAVDTIAGVEEQLRILGGSAKAKILKVARDRLLSNDFRIIFCGEFKRGKSTLINAMLGNKVLPMKVAPCTGVITEVKFDGLPRVQVHPEEGETFDAPIEDLRKHTSIVGDDAPPTNRVEVFYPIDLCENAVTLIDSPGLNEDWRRTQISLQELTKADAAVMVLSCEMALSRSELDFITAQLSERKSGIFFVWNRYDAIWNDNEEISSLRTLSNNHLPKFSENIFFLSAREALVAQRKNDDTRFDRSQLQSFMDALEEFLATKRGQVKLMVPLQQATQATKYGIETLSTRALNLFNAPLEELRKTEKTLQPRLEDLEKQRQNINENINDEIDEILNELILCLDTYLNEIAQKAYQDSSGLQFSPDSNRQERQDKLLRWFRDWLQKSLQQLAKNKMEPILHKGIQELQTELQSKREIFHADVKDLLEIETELDLSSAPLFDMEWFQNVPLFISTAVALLILGASSGFIAISLLGVGALRAWLAGSTLDDHDRRKVAEALSKSLKNRRKEIIEILRNQLEKTSEELKMSINEEMKQLIDDTKQQLYDAVSARQAGETAAEEAEVRITNAKNELQRYLIVLQELSQDD